MLKGIIMNSNLQLLYTYILKQEGSFLNTISIISTIFVNFSILYVFYKTYFSRNLKILSFGLKMDTFFGQEFNISINNRTLKPFVIDKYYNYFKKWILF